MYSAGDFKKDLIINLKEDGEYPKELWEALVNSEFEFEDSSNFTKRGWNTYTRVLIIFCRTKEKGIIDEYKEQLYHYCDQLHGVKDDYMIMKLNVFIKASLDDTALTDEEIIITKKVVINKKSDLIGNGGFASIYKKDEPHNETTYAYKVFDPSSFQSSDQEVMRKRFVREAKKLLSYSHENIIHAYDFGFLGDSSAYIKMEYIKGKRLYDYIKESLLNDEDKERLADQYISAMAYIHSKADVHRDISFSNIMVTSDGNLKVLDFGFSKNNDDTNYDTEYADIAHKFNPPDNKYDIKTEVYCIGAVIFTIFTEVEFHNTKISLLDEVECKEKYKKIIKKCLEINPEDRFQNAVELLAVLDGEDQICNKAVMLPEMNDFTLDEFKNLIDLHVNKISFHVGGIPTYLTIKLWIQRGLLETITAYKFLSKISIEKIFSRLPNIYAVYTYEDMDNDVNKSIINNIYNAYNSFSEEDRQYLIKGIQEIVYSKAIEDDIPF